MKDTDRPNRASNMEKAEGDRDDDARNQEQSIERRPDAADPTGNAKKTPEPEKTEDEPTLRTEM